MADFLTSYKITMGNEGAGELSDNPNDKGGRTYSGISQKFNPAWAGWATIESMRSTPNFPDCLKQSTVLGGQVLAFYKANYWDVLKADQYVDQLLATELFDLGVNCGTGIAGEFLQRSLNVLNNGGTKYADISVDGEIGAGTISALAKANTKDVLKCVVALQGNRYVEICEKNGTQEEFMSGWIRRAFEEV